MSSLFQFLNTALASLFVLLIILYYVLVRPRTTKSSSNGKKTAPEAPGAWPLIGHLPSLAGKELPHITLGAMADKYGPIFTLKLGVHRALVLSSCEVVKECYTTLDMVFASRPSIVAFKHMGYNDAMFIATPYGPYWREVRKIATLELLSNRRLEMLKHVRASEVDMSIKELYELCAKKKKIGTGQVLVEMKRWFGELTFNVTIRMICGKRYFGTNSEDEEEARKCQKVVRDFFHLSGLFVVSDSFPFLGWLDVGGYERAMKRTAKDLDCFLQGWLEEHRSKKLSGKTEGDQDFMDVMLSILEDAKLSDYDADTINKATSMNIGWSYLVVDSFNIYTYKKMVGLFIVMFGAILMLLYMFVRMLIQMYDECIKVLDLVLADQSISLKTI
ncbi:hypothetical protein HHK36_015062 [Tetracentron sinense]|uniref:Cytochrome P450 n=1 Tax=Tetracentron sinense TaxID=13715 RepID=A0A835DFU5_TETSI|nr:hypothetical protein HHK36_015062 [Tetracentron sinense]